MRHQNTDVTNVIWGNNFALLNVLSTNLSKCVRFKMILKRKEECQNVYLTASSSSDVDFCFFPDNSPSASILDESFGFFFGSGFVL